MAKRFALASLLVTGSLVLILFLANTLKPVPAQAIATNIFIKAAYQNYLDVQNDDTAQCDRSGARVWIGHAPQPEACRPETLAITVTRPGIYPVFWTAHGLAMPNVGDYACLAWRCTTDLGPTYGEHGAIVGPYIRPTPAPPTLRPTLPPPTLWPTPPPPTLMPPSPTPRPTLEPPGPNPTPAFPTPRPTLAPPTPTPVPPSPTPRPTLAPPTPTSTPAPSPPRPTPAPPTSTPAPPPLFPRPTPAP